METFLLNRPIGLKSLYPLLDIASHPEKLIPGDFFALLHRNAKPSMDDVFNKLIDKTINRIVLEEHRESREALKHEKKQLWNIRKRRDPFRNIIDVIKSKTTFSEKLGLAYEVALICGVPYSKKTRLEKTLNTIRSRSELSCS